MAAGLFSDTSETFIIQGCKLVTPKKKKRRSLNNTFRENVMTRTIVPKPHKPIGLLAFYAICFL
jgi:hypothetical protein